jgi:ABC-type oligopeptide transport system ATPase subunit
MKEKLKIDDNYYSLANRLLDELQNRLSKNKLIIGISGESGSGKSTTGFCLTKLLENSSKKVVYLQMGDYFKLCLLQQIIKIDY